MDDSTPILVIDVHEPKEIKQGCINIPHRLEALNVGDYCFINKEGMKVLIIERKTISDLKSSLADGRFREQRGRLLDLGIKIIYIIEGAIPMDRRILGALENLALQHNICIIPSNTIVQTISVLTSLYKKVFTEYTPTLLTFSSGKKKKEHEKSSLEIMLETINGVSPTISKAICLKYSSVKQLIEDLETDTTILKSIEINPKRKLGLKLAERISSSFLQ